MRRLSDLSRRGWLIAAAGALIVLVAGLFWLRDSPLVAVDEVAITGASGPDAPRIEASLRAVARDMTTLHVREDELRQAIEEFPTVDDIKVESDFPHGLRIEVVERSPVAVVGEGEGRAPITAGGTVLRGATAPDDLPVIDDEGSERVLELLALAPRQLLRRAERAFDGPKGLTVRMAEGPILYFGGSDDLEAKWAAAARVLADPTAEGAAYIDIRVPERTAAGGVVPIEVPAPEEEAVDPAAAETPAEPVDPAVADPTAAPEPTPETTAPPVDPATGAPLTEATG